MCLMIKEEKVFDKYMEIQEKVNNAIEKTNNELIYRKKYLIAKKHVTPKECFNAFIEE